MPRVWTLTLIASCILLSSPALGVYADTKHDVGDSPDLQEISKKINKVEEQIADSKKLIESDSAIDIDLVASLQETVNSMKKLKDDIKQMIANASIQKSHKEPQPSPFLLLQNDHKDLDPSVVTNIRQQQFNQAEFLIAQMSEHEVAKVVQDIYSPYTYVLLLNFTRAVTKISSSYYLLNEIYNAQQINHHLDALQLILLGKMTHSEILNQPGNSTNIKAKAQLLYNAITDSLTTASAQVITAAVRNNQYRSDKNRYLLDEIYKYSGAAFDTTMEKFVDEAYKSLSAFDILESINSHSTDDQKVAGVAALFWKLKESGRHDKAKTGVAWTLNTLQMSEIYTKLTKSQKKALDTAIENLPGCMKFIYPDRAVCIMNRKTNGYLSASNTSHNLDNQRRVVYTSGNGRILLDSEWFVQSYGGYAYFMNRKQHMEYLYASAMKISNMRNVFTWIPGGNVGLQGGWDVEISNNDCFLKNAYFNEHLQASLRETTPNMQVVYMSRIDSDPFGNLQALWEMKDCN